ncbi:coiled-coil domain-containing protein 55-domain containing protein [Syncephalis fuscata]|nr:coiled-coil domain-containing protein 55-domain containing protein [Syncephalis fuscata]
MSLSFGLNLTKGSRKKPNTSFNTASKARKKPSNVFGNASSSDDDDEAYFKEDDTSEGKDKTGLDEQRAAQQRVNRDLKRQAQSSSSSGGAAGKTPTEEDASIYAYDEIYDDMKAAENQQRTKHKSNDKERKPRYMTDLMRSAEVRKKDLMRAEERKIQREREAEGSAFADKEKFVTSAYKKQQEEMRKYEEEVRRREEAERIQGQGDITGFYRTMLDHTAETRSAALKVSLEGASSITLSEEQKKEKKSIKQSGGDNNDEVERARAAGLDVRLNADNAVIDKRELLSAGLNISRSAQSYSVRQGVVNARARDEAAAAAHKLDADKRARAAEERERRQALERKRREDWQEQMAERNAQQAAEQAAEQTALAEKLARRTTTDQVSDARARFLARQAAKKQAKPADEDSDSS